MSVRFEGKRSWRACDFYAADGRLRLCAAVTGIPADIPVRAADTDELRLWLRPRPIFAVTGRYDVNDARSGEHLGILERGGRILDAREHPVAAIADPATLGDWVKEGVVNALVDAALAMGEGRAAAHRADELQLHAGGRLIGLCQRTDLPFAPRVTVDRVHQRHGRSARPTPPSRRGPAAHRDRAPVSIGVIAPLRSVRGRAP